MSGTPKLPAGFDSWLTDQDRYYGYPNEPGTREPHHDASFGMSRREQTVYVCADHLAFLLKDISPSVAAVHWLQVTQWCEFRCAGTETIAEI